MFEGCRDVKAGRWHGLLQRESLGGQGRVKTTTLDSTATSACRTGCGGSGLRSSFQAPALVRRATGGVRACASASEQLRQPPMMPEGCPDAKEAGCAQYRVRWCPATVVREGRNRHRGRSRVVHAVNVHIARRACICDVAVIKANAATQDLAPAERWKKRTGRRRGGPAAASQRSAVMQQCAG